MNEFQYPISEVSQNFSCCKCGHNGGRFIELCCEHVYCITCASFLYSKCRKQYSNQSAIRCSICATVSLLEIDSIQFIKNTLKNQILPSIESQNLTTENKLTVTKNSQFSHYIGAINRKIKSQEHSFENFTPSTTKCFFSKCQSPSSRKKMGINNNNNSMTCASHAIEPITYICLTCGIQMLCIKCISSSKKHSGHDLKDIKKARAMMIQQLSLNQLQLNYKVDEAQMYQRRLDDRNILIKDRVGKILADIRQGFADLYSKLEQKQFKIISECQDHFSTIMQTLEIQNSKTKYYLDLLQKHRDQIISLKNQQQSHEFFKNYSAYQRDSSVTAFNIHNMPGQKMQVPSNSIFRQIQQAIQKVNNFKVNFKLTNLSRIQTTDNQFMNCRSESKLKKQSGKRIKTNFVSLNSSRDKKRKNTKTQEDQRRNKHHHAHCGITSKNTGDKQIVHKKNKMPTYITDFINKKANNNNKFTSQSASYIHQLTSHDNHNFTKVSKLSKTISPQEIVRRKKQHKAVIRERLDPRKKNNR